jgi:hypothetical protein
MLNQWPEIGGQPGCRGNKSEVLPTSPHTTKRKQPVAHKFAVSPNYRENITTKLRTSLQEKVNNTARLWVNTEYKHTCSILYGK